MSFKRMTSSSPILNPYASAVPFLPVYIDTKNRYKMDFLTIKQYLISIFPLTVKRSCLNIISLKR